MNTYGDPNSGSVFYVSVVGTIILVITLIFLEALFYQTANDELERKVINRPNVQLEAHRAEQFERLHGYGVEANFEQRGTRVSVPIERAMEAMIRAGRAALDNEEEPAIERLALTDTMSTDE